VIVQEENRSSKEIICERSTEADLILLGFRGESMKRNGAEIFRGYEGLGNILFVHAVNEKEISML
jgi:hypothetical protein